MLGGGGLNTPTYFFRNRKVPFGVIYFLILAREVHRPSLCPVPLRTANERALSQSTPSPRPTPCYRDK